MHNHGLCGPRTHMNQWEHRWNIINTVVQSSTLLSGNNANMCQRCGTALQWKIIGNHWNRHNFMRVNCHRTVWKHSDVMHRAPGPVNTTSVSRIAIVHAEVHCDAEMTFQDRSWLHASKFLPQIEIVFKTIQFAVHPWGVDNRVSLIMRKKSKLFSIIVTVSDLLSVFFDHWLIANCSCTKLMPQLSNAHGPKSAYIFKVNAFIPLLTWWWFVQDTRMGHRWVSDPNNLPCYNLSPIDRIKESFVRSIGVDLLSRNSSLWSKVMCTFLPQHMLCITNQKQMHALHIVVIQNMIVHCSLYAIEFWECPII